LDSDLTRDSQQTVLQRFKIEDLVVQDASGVEFRAFDAETNQAIALRRFFPFGASGGGLDADQQAAYGIAVERLSKISHPAMRSIICGGCDPVDGMPFVATEWIEGTALQTLLWSRPLEELEAITVISLALEVCEILSEVMAEEGIWIETDSHTIIIGEKDTQRPVTFWISPLKWLGHEDGRHSLEPFISLTTSITGWAGKPFETLSTTGLGNWLAWLYSAARTATLHEAREKLSEAVGVEPPLPVKRQTGQATRQVLKTSAKQKRSSKAPARIMAFAVLLLLGGGGCWMIKRNEANLVKAQAPLIVKIESAGKDIPPPVVAAQVQEESPASSEPVELPKRSSASVDTSAVNPPAANKDVEYSATSYDLLVAQRDKITTIVGTFGGIGYSNSKDMMHLLFFGNSGESAFRLAVATKEAKGDLSETSLKSMIGREIRVTGKVFVENPDRPVIKIANFKEIELMK
jgi:hypothetical protein